MSISTKNQVRVRIAPSPTGPLHLGTTRTALFNWLFARHHKGTFILRIEDTDLERSDPQYEAEIIEGLKWLGITWDEFYRQSERLETYEKCLKKLLDEQKAYYCYCAEEELDAEKQGQIKKGLSPKYNGKCRNGKPPAKTSPGLIRFKMPEETITFHDLIRGEIKFDMRLVGDIAIAKPLKHQPSKRADVRAIREDVLLGFSPLYNFAVVVDDHEMGISHVIRGEDHIANTPKQIAMQRALNFNVPTYAHLPLILNPDRSKLSKRYAETSLLAYRGKYLPEAVINFMAFLGWHPKEEKDVMTAEELIKEFDLERVQKAGAVFNEEKLKWLNAEHMKRKQDQVIQTTAQGILENYSGVTPEKAHSTAELIFSRMKTLDDYNELAKPILELLFYEPELLIWKNTNKSIAKAHLGAVKKIINELEPLDLNRAEEAIMAYANTEGRGEVLWPLRVALSGERDSQGPFELMKVLGKDETLRRINIAINKL